MGLSRKIIGGLVALSLLSFFSVVGGFPWYEQKLTEYNITLPDSPIGQYAMYFTGYGMLLLLGATITWLLIKSAQRRRISKA